MNFVRKNIFLSLFGVLVFLAFIFSLFLLAPTNFPEGLVVNIDEGSSLRSVSSQLKRASIIRSRIAFEAFVFLYDGESHIISADYLFENKLSVYEVARRIVRGERHLAPIKITIPEGFNIFDIANTFALKLSNFNQENFLFLAKEKEGYLFPDTYFFLTQDDENNVFKSMSDNFEKKIVPILPAIISSGKNKIEIIIMASVIEKEAKGDADRGFISGILWKRISLGMPLQVDADPSTYKTKGLPKRPIGNPGLEAINAALYPERSPYLYYLHDKNGIIHYAKNFEEHKKNIKFYLKN